MSVVQTLPLGDQNDDSRGPTIIKLEKILEDFDIQFS